MYESTESYCCHFDVSVSLSMGHGITLESLRQSFILDGQDTVRQAVLYADRSYYKGKQLMWLPFDFPIQRIHSKGKENGRFASSEGVSVYLNILDPDAILGPVVQN